MDLAIGGAGFFLLRHPETEAEYLTRAGQFLRNESGYLTNPDGLILQAAGGGALRTETADFEVGADGMIYEDGAAIAQVGVFTVSDPAGLSAVSGTLFSVEQDGDPEPVPDFRVSITQGALESSNVKLGNEMVQLTQAVRQAETGARLIQAYDSLMSNAISTFGRGGR